MAEIDFADGFDVPEPLAWGLTPGQLGTVVAGAVLAYLGLRSPLPRVAAIPLALLACGGGLVLALVRHEGRALVAWAGAATRFWARPRRGLLIVEESREGLAGTPRDVGADESSASSPDRPGLGTHWSAPRERRSGELEAPRRLPLVLLPTPPLEVADAPVLEAPTRAPGPLPASAARAPSRSGAWSGETAAFPPVRAARRITFFSLCGGTGRTTLAVETAGLLAAPTIGRGPWERPREPRVALVDLDLLCPGAGLRLGIPSTTDWGLLETEAAETSVGRLLAIHSSGVHVLPGPSWVPEASGGDPDGLIRRVEAAVSELERRGCETIVVDVRSDLGPLSRWALGKAHDIFVVLNPTAGGVHDAYRTTAALRRMGVGRKLRYVVNRGRAEPVFTEALLDLGATVVAEIPEDPALERAESEHRLVARESSGPTAAALRALAATLDPLLLASSQRRGQPGGRRIFRRRAC